MEPKLIAERLSKLELITQVKEIDYILLKEFYEALMDDFNDLMAYVCDNLPLPKKTYEYYMSELNKAKSILMTIENEILFRTQSN